VKRAVYVLKRVDIDSSKVYVIKNKSSLKKFLNKSLANGGVYMQITMLFHNESEMEKYFEKCRKLGAIILN